MDENEKSDVDLDSFDSDTDVNNMVVDLDDDFLNSLDCNPIDFEVRQTYDEAQAIQKDADFLFDDDPDYNPDYFLEETRGLTFPSMEPHPPPTSEDNIHDKKGKFFDEKQPECKEEEEVPDLFGIRAFRTILDSSSDFEIKDPCIFLRLWSYSGEKRMTHNWFVIPRNSAELHDKLLDHSSPIKIPKEPEYKYTSDCVAVSGLSSSSIFLYNCKKRGERNTCTSLLEVELGSHKVIPWKDGPKHSRSHSTAVSLSNEKIAIMNWDSPKRSCPFVEVFDVQQDKLIPMNARKPEKVNAVRAAHAFVDDNGGQHVLFHGSPFPNIYDYNLELDECSLLSSHFLTHSETTALVDGILYAIIPGVLLALDVNNPNATQKRVALQYPPNHKVWWIPQATHFGDRPSPYLVGLGNGRLAMVWSIRVHNDMLCIWCTKWDMRRTPTKDGEFAFTALITSRTRHYTLFQRLENCLPLALSP